MQMLSLLVDAILDKKRVGIAPTYYGFLHRSLLTKDGRSFGKKGSILMPNTLSEKEIEDLIKEGYTEKDLCLSLEDLSEEFIEDTEEKGIIIKNVEYFEYSEFIEKSLEFFNK